MKQCPQCGREYDLSMSFCLDDGSELLYGPATSGANEQRTAILHETAASGEVATRAQIHMSGQTADLPSGKASLTGEMSRKKSSDKRLLLVPFVIALVAFGGYVGYRQFGTPVETDQIDSIAVLPFQNRSDDPDTDYLSDGLAESLIFRLTQLPGLKVSPTSTVMRYKGQDADTAQVASELGVDAVMTGRFVKRGDNLNITVELVDARSNKALWGEQYQKKMSDLLATQREIAATIVEKLQLRFSGDEAKGITKKYTDSNDAYQLYLRGRHSFAKRTKDEMLRSIGYFREAVRIDPKFALAWARISEVYGSMPAYPYLSPKEAFPEAKAAAQKALEIDPTLPEAHAFLAYALIIHDWNWTEGERSFKRALELDPSNFSARFRYGQIYLLPVGRFDEAISEMEQGLKAEPLDMNMAGSVAWGELVRGRNETALAQIKKLYDLEPTHPLTRWILSQTLSEMGKYDEAMAVAEKWLQDEPNNQLAIRDAGVAYAKAGQRAKAEAMIARYRELSRTEWIPVGRIAAIYAALGEKDKAFAELERAFEERDWDMHRLKIEVYTRSLRSDPRFAGFLKRLGLPE